MNSSGKITVEDILSPESYGRKRDEENHRLAVFEKKRRLVTKTFSFLFEHREIVVNQINEMVYLEKIKDSEEIKDLIQIYSEQLPSRGTLSVTMFIEFTDEKTMLNSMRKLSGVEKKVFLVFQDNDIDAEFEEGRSTENLESTLQYLKFHLNDKQVRDFLSTDAAYIEVRQPGYEETARIPADLLATLKEEIR